MGFIGVDNTGGTITNSTTETKIGEVIVSANSVNTRMIIIAGVRFRNNLADSNISSTFRIRTGTSATATSNTERKSIVLAKATAATGTAGQGRTGGVIMAMITSAEETLTGQIYVHVTGANDTAGASVDSICDFVYVLGI